MEGTVDSCIYSGKSAPRIVDREEREGRVERREEEEEERRKRDCSDPIRITERPSVMVGRRWAGQPEEQSRPVNKYILLWHRHSICLNYLNCWYTSHVPIYVHVYCCLLLLQSHSSMRSTALPDINGIGDGGS